MRSRAMSDSPAVRLVTNTPHSKPRAFVRLVRVSYAFAFFFVFLCVCASSQAQNPGNYDTANIMSALRATHDDLVMLSSHRGVHALVDGSNKFVPENSLQAIGLAAQAGLEIVEIDLKMTSDKQVVLSHDTTWGREICYSNHWYATSPFDPFTAPGSNSNDSTNPKISDVPPGIHEVVLVFNLPQGFRQSVLWS